MSASRTPCTVVPHVLTGRGRKAVGGGSVRMAGVSEQVTTMRSTGGTEAVARELRTILIELEGSDRPM